MKFEYPIAAGKRSSSIKESKDCTVRALANTSYLSYEESHSLMEMYGRKRNKGAQMKVFDRAYISMGFELMGVYGTTAAAKHYRHQKNIHDISKGLTLNNALKLLQEGSYIVLVSGHALAVVDGEVIDTFPSKSGTRVVAIYKKL